MCVLQAELAEQAATLTQQLSQALATIGELEAAVESKNNEITEVRREASDAAASTAAAEETQRMISSLFWAGAVLGALLVLPAAAAPSCARVLVSE